MIISVVGPMQSGSTLLFNLLRIISTFAGKNTYSSWYFKRQKNMEEKCDYAIYKIHEYSDNLVKHSDLIFLPIRDIRDCVSSAKKRWPKKYTTVDSVVARAKHNLELIKKWEPHAGYCFVYEKYKKNPIIQITKLCKMLKFDFKPWKIKQIYKKSNMLYKDSRLPVIDNFKSKFYQRTLLTKRHNTSNGAVGHYAKHLSKTEIDELNKLLLLSPFVPLPLKI